MSPLHCRGPASTKDPVIQLIRKENQLNRFYYCRRLRACNVLTRPCGSFTFRSPAFLERLQPQDCLVGSFIFARASGYKEDTWNVYPMGQVQASENPL